MLSILENNITASPGNCRTFTTSPNVQWNDLAQISFMRYHLDVTCSLYSQAPLSYGQTPSVGQVQQCSCGAKICPPGVLCTVNTLPELCPKGKYCESFGSTAKSCPEGYYCPAGTADPVACNPGAVCWEGADRPYEFVPFFFLVLGLVGMWVLRHFLERRRNQKLTGRIQADIKRVAEIQDMGSALDAKLRENNLNPALLAAQRINISFNCLGLRVQAPTGACFGLFKAKNFSNVDDDGMITRLASVTGSMKSGTVTGVMGPSGSGKTTFMHVLCGKLQHNLGKIKINGREGSLRDFRQHVGYVPQDDIVDARLTVKEALMHSANTRLSLPVAERVEKVNSVLLGLGLWKVQHSVIGDASSQGVSGGEKKRVNIGTELVANPSVLFLDEPTTGLDATAAQDVMICLSKLAKSRKMTVCAVLHQPRPEIAELLDQLLLLATGGRICWLGPLDDALVYFASQGFICPPNCDTPDFLLDILSGSAKRTTDARELKAGNDALAARSSSLGSGSFSAGSNEGSGEEKELFEDSDAEKSQVARRKHTIAEVSQAYERTKSIEKQEEVQQMEQAPPKLLRSSYGLYSMLSQAYYFVKRAFILRILRWV